MYTWQNPNLHYYSFNTPFWQQHPNVLLTFAHEKDWIRVSWSSWWGATTSDNDSWTNNNVYEREKKDKKIGEMLHKITTNQYWFPCCVTSQIKCHLEATIFFVTGSHQSSLLWKDGDWKAKHKRKNKWKIVLNNSQWIFTPKARNKKN